MSFTKEQLFTPHYQEMNKKMNAKHNWASANLNQLGPIILSAANEIEAESILDYGCGPAFLGKMMTSVMWPGVWRNYDPGVPEYEALPEPADLVVCNSVLEHSEPEFLDNVLDHLASVTKHTVLIIISCYPSGLVLEDGTSPHKIVENPNWWMPHLIKRFNFKRGDSNRQFFFRGTKPGIKSDSFDYASGDKKLGE